MEADDEFAYTYGTVAVSEGGEDLESDPLINIHDFEYNGSVTIEIDINNITISENDQIGAFHQNECRGVAERMYFPFGDSYMYSLMVYSNDIEDEELRFKYYDSENGEIVAYAETMNFTSDMIIGDGFEPFALSREGNSIQPQAYRISDAYPNPFNPVTSFSYTIPEDGMVQVAIYDVNGRMVAELINGYQSAGTHPVVWDANELSSGVYMVKLLTGSTVNVQKIMLVK